MLKQKKREADNTQMLKQKKKEAENTILNISFFCSCFCSYLLLHPLSSHTCLPQCNAPEFCILWNLGQKKKEAEQNTILNIFFFLLLFLFSVMLLFTAASLIFPHLSCSVQCSYSLPQYNAPEFCTLWDLSQKIMSNKHTTIQLNKIQVRRFCHTNIQLYRLDNSKSID